MKAEKFIDLAWRIAKHRNELLTFLHELLDEWEDNPELPDDTEVSGITQGHLRKAKALIERKTDAG